MRSLSRFLALCLVATVPPAPGRAQVGFTQVTIALTDGTPLTTGIWYPTLTPSHPITVGLTPMEAARDAPPLSGPHPVVLISHGNGGDLTSHANLAIALAQAGFIAAAPRHDGDNFLDHRRELDPLPRAHALSAVLDYLATTWHPGSAATAHAGAFGFSAGAMTVLLAAGGRLDLARLGPHCTNAAPYFDCALMRTHARRAPPRPTWIAVRDPRIAAIAIAAPALGFAFGPEGLAAVTQPVQLWQADDDRVLPPALYAAAVRGALPAPPEFHAVPGAGHFDFLPPCPTDLARAAPSICASAATFDRAAFQRGFTAAVVAFFKAHLSERHAKTPPGG